MAVIREPVRWIRRARIAARMSRPDETMSTVNQMPFGMLLFLRFDDAWIMEGCRENSR